MKLSIRKKGIFLAVLGSVFWGGSGVAGQFLLQDRGMTVEWLVVVRMLVAGILLLGMDKAVSQVGIFEIWKQPASRYRLLAFGFMGMLMVQYTYFMAIEASNAATATVLQFTMPVIIIMWTAIRACRWPKLYESVCAMMAIMGTAVLVTHGDFDRLAVSDRALSWGILSAFAAAFYTTQPRWLLMRWSSTNVIGWAMLIGGVMLGIVFPPGEYPGYADGPGVFSLVYLIVFGTAVSFWAFVTSTKYIKPQESSIINALEPLSSIVLSVTILGISFGGWEMLGAMLIVMPIAYISSRGDE